MANEKIRLAIICSPLAFSGGTFRHLLSWCKNLDHNRFSIALFCNFINEEQEKLASSHFSAIENLVFKPVDTMFPLRKLLAGGWLKLVKEIRRFKPDIIHSVYIQTDLICAAIKPLLNFPKLVSSWEGSLAGKSFHSTRTIWLYRQLLSLASSQINRFFAISSATANENCLDFSIPAEKVQVLHSGLDLDLFPKLQEQTAPVAGLISRFTEEKKISIFIEAIPKILEKFPEATFILAGDGPEKRNLENLARSLGVLDKVKFTGWSSDVVEVLKQLQIFVFTSAGEGLPWCILEALSCGLPTVASAVGGIGEVIKHDINGLLVYDNQPQSFANEVCRLFASQAMRQRISLAARQTIEAGFTTNREITALQNEYEKLMKR